MGQYDHLSASDLIANAARRDAHLHAKGAVIQELKKINQTLREADEKKGERKN